MREIIRSFSKDFDDLVKAKINDTAFVVNSELYPTNVTYGELGELVERAVALFEERGLTQGDVILSVMPNSIETIILFLASLKGGYGFAPLPCTATPIELSRWVKIVNPKVCFTTDLISTKLKEGIATAKLKEENLTINSQFEWLPFEKSKTSSEGSRVYLSTSGTTGAPKAMVLSGDKLWSSGHSFMKHLELEDEGLVFWNYLPMSYLGGLFNLTLIPLSVGASTIVDEPFSGKTFLSFWQTKNRYDINTIWFVPSIVRGLLKFSKRYSEDELKVLGKNVKNAFLGTAPIDLSTKQEFEEKFGITCLENFALSETTFFSSETKKSIDTRSEYSMGKILPYVEVKTVGEEAELNSKDIWVKSPFMFLGYLGEDSKLIEPFDDEGFFKTGDLGYIEDNILKVNGRSRDIIKKGGYMVPLREIEVLAEKSDLVQEAAAVKESHDFYGESYTLYVIMKGNDGDLDIQRVNEYIHKNLVSYKWPEKVVLVTDFPRTSSGKIRKHLISEDMEN